jgi:hypothetical protein
MNGKNTIGGNFVGLVHEFLLVPKNKLDSFYDDYVWDESGFNAEKSGVTDYIEVDDDLIQYVMDSLNWIPSYNPSKTESGFGLNYYGITLIRQDGALVAKNIFNSWADLFSHGPDVLELRGSFSWEDDNLESGSYETLKFARNDLVGIFRKLALYAEEVLIGELNLLHLGL